MQISIRHQQLDIKSYSTLKLVILAGLNVAKCSNNKCTFLIVQIGNNSFFIIVQIVNNNNNLIFPSITHVMGVLSAQNTFQQDDNMKIGNAKKIQ